MGRAGGAIVTESTTPADAVEGIATIVNRIANRDIARSLLKDPKDRSRRLIFRIRIGVITS